MWQAIVLALTLVGLGLFVFFRRRRAERKNQEYEQEARQRRFRYEKLRQRALVTFKIQLPHDIVSFERNRGAILYREGPKIEEVLLLIASEYYWLRKRELEVLSRVDGFASDQLPEVHLEIWVSAAGFELARELATEMGFMGKKSLAEYLAEIRVQFPTHV